MKLFNRMFGSDKLSEVDYAVKYLKAEIEVIKRGQQIINLENIIRECHEQLCMAIYDDDSIDGDKVQKLLDKIEKKVWVETSHRYIDPEAKTI